jgi:demethylsterigmatocystin 6-O-methyltransferase
MQMTAKASTEFISFDVQLPCWIALPEFLKSITYKNPSDARNTPFQIAHSTELPAFKWAMKEPRLFEDFSLWMTAQRQGELSWLDIFPPECLTATPDSSAPLFVDVGGGVGHQCAALKRRYPELARRIVLEDLAPVIMHAIPVDGVEHLIHDFWTEQPVRNASYYYLRNVLHDYPDEKCIVLLQLQMDAMSESSTLLIDEMIIPDYGAHWQATEVDITMMASLASIERSKEQWQDLFRVAGLAIKEIFTYSTDLGHSLMLVQRT